ncbi:MAG TPA: hypothetical protein VGG99_10855 [Acetobacteraceae bacterium]|jgi:hypothetical protein
MPSNPTVAFDNSASLVGTQNYAGSLGMDFTVERQITIDDLGAFNNGQTDMAASITVGIYDVATQQLIGQLETISGTARTEIDGSRFETLATPLVLNAGTTYSVVAWGYDSALEEYNPGSAGSSLITTNSDSGAIAFVDSGRYGTAGAFPTGIDAGPADRYAAGTFEFTSSTITSSFTVGTEAALDAGLVSIENGGSNAGAGVAYTIALSSGFTLTSDMQAVALLTGSSLTVNGGGNTISGNGQYRGFFAYSGTLTLNDLTLGNMVAQGGAGGSGGTAAGGGGAGLGGAVFVGKNASVTLYGVQFSSDAAKGGAGGYAATGGGRYGRGGGGGLGTNGGGGTFSYGGGGGSGVPGVSGYTGGSGTHPTTGSGGSGAFGGGGGADGDSATTTTSGGAGGFGGGGAPVTSTIMQPAALAGSAAARADSELT